MIFITGDKHGDLVFVKDFCENNKGLCREDVLIILGDVGINYDLNRQEKKVKMMLSKLPITLLCVQMYRVIYGDAYDFNRNEWLWINDIS